MKLRVGGFFSGIGSHISACERLKDAQENGKRKYPKTIVYKFAGNAVCVDCFVRIVEQILDDAEESV